MIDINGVEYATKEEAQLALDAIEPLVPQKDEEYCTYEYDLEGEVFRDSWYDDSIDRARLTLGIVFRTESEEEAKAHQQSVHNPYRRGAAIHALRTAAGNTGVNWKDMKQKYCPRWDHDEKEIHGYGHSSSQPNDLPAFLTIEDFDAFYADPTNHANAKIALGIEDDK